MNDTRLYIAVPVFGRANLVYRCLSSFEWPECDRLALYDDNGEFGGSGRLEGLGDEVHSVPVSLGIEAQRRQHFADFWNRHKAEGFTHLYLTDSDAIHDPSWRSELLRLQEKYNGVPICGYNTAAHVRLLGNTIADVEGEEVIWRRVAPGISYLLTVGHVAIVMRHIHEMTNWDWQVPGWLGNRFAVTRTSLVSHIGWQGLHHPESEGMDGGDVPLNPTPYLVAKRAEIIEKLRHET